MTLAPRPRSTSSRGEKPKNLLSFFFAATPPPPRREAEILKGRKFLVLPPPLHSSKKANKCSLAFLPVLRPPFLRRLRRPEALPSPRFVVVRCPLTLRKHLALAARFAHDACSVLLRVRSVTSVMFVAILKKRIVPNYQMAQANHIALAPTLPCARKRKLPITL